MIADIAGLHPAQLFHIGMVVADIDSALLEMSASLGLQWKGGRPTMLDLCLYGEERRVEMRIAHSRQGPPHFEVIQTLPDSPWALPAAGVHHVCYWSEDSAAVCAGLEAAGNRRVLGRAGAASGYFLSPSGMYVEIIHRDLRDHLAGWLAREG